LEYFEIDRSTVSRQLQNLMRAIDEGAEDIEMAAAEGVFDKSTFSSAPPSRWPVAPDRERLERSATLGRSSAYPDGQLNDPKASEGGVAHAHFATDFAFRELDEPCWQKFSKLLQ
jgi:hypothetical protein